MKLDRRGRLLVGVLAVLFVVGIPGRIAWGLRSSALADASAIRDDTDGKRLQLEKAVKAKANEPVLRQKLDVLKAAMPATPDQQSLLDTLAGLAKDTNVSWEVMSSAIPQSAKGSTRDTTADTTADTSGDTPTAKSSAPAATASTTADSSSAGSGSSSAATTSFSFDATVSGDDASVSAFLEQVRSIDRLVVIDKVQLSWAHATGNVNGAASARLSMRAFIWKAGAKKIAPPASTASTTTTGTTVAP